MRTTQCATIVAYTIADDPCPLTADTIREIAGEPRDALILPRPEPGGASTVTKFPPGRPIPMPADVREAADFRPLDAVTDGKRQMMVFGGDMVIVVDTISLHTPTSTSNCERIQLYVHGRRSAVPVDAVDTAKIRARIVDRTLDLPMEILEGEGRHAHVARVMHVLRAGYDLSDLMIDGPEWRRGSLRVA